MPEIRNIPKDPQQSNGVLTRVHVETISPPKPSVAEQPKRSPKVTVYRQDIREMRPTPKQTFGKRP